MGFLDWMRNRNGQKPDPDLDPRTHGHNTWQGVFDEIRQDEALAKIRDQTGREPETPAKTIRRTKPSWER